MAVVRTLSTSDITLQKVDNHMTSPSNSLTKVEQLHQWIRDMVEASRQGKKIEQQDYLKKIKVLLEENPSLLSQSLPKIGDRIANKLGWSYLLEKSNFGCFERDKTGNLFIVSHGRKEPQRPPQNVLPLFTALSKPTLCPTALTLLVELCEDDDALQTILNDLLNNLNLTKAQKREAMNAHNEKGETPLSLWVQKTAAGDPKRLEVLEAFKKWGAKFNLPNEQGYTPFMLALSNCKIGLAELLLEKVKNPVCLLTKKNKAGDTPLSLFLLRWPGVIPGSRENPANEERPIKALNIILGWIKTYVSRDFKKTSSLLTHAVRVAKRENRGEGVLKILEDQIPISEKKVRTNTNRGMKKEAVKKESITRKDSRYNRLSTQFSFSSIEVPDVLKNQNLSKKEEDSRIRTQDEKKIALSLHKAVWNKDIETFLSLTNRGVEINDRDYQGMTPLYLSVYKDNQDMTGLLLTGDGAANPNIPDVNGVTPLHVAVERNNKASVSALLDAKAKIDQQDKTGATPLHWAIQRNHEEIVSMLLDKGANPTISNVNGVTPLHLAAEKSKVGLIFILLSKKVDIEARDSTGATPLLWAIGGNNREAVETLLIRGANFEAQNQEGWRPIHVATANGNEEIVTILLNKGTSLRAKNKANNTALHLALEKGYQEVALSLIKKGLRSEYLDLNRNNVSTFHLAVWRGYKDVVQVFLKDKNYAKKGIDRKEVIDSKDREGNTPLHLAVSQGHTEIIKALLKAKADLQVKNHKGETPLSIAINKNDINTTALLLEVKTKISYKNDGNFLPYFEWAFNQKDEKDDQLISDLLGINLNFLDDNGDALLHKAISRGASTELIKRFLKTKIVNVNIQDPNMDTPLHLAVARDRKDVIELLLSAGANISVLNDEEETPWDLAQESDDKEIKEMFRKAQDGIYQRERDRENIKTHFENFSKNFSREKRDRLPRADVPRSFSQVQPEPQLNRQKINESFRAFSQNLKIENVMKRERPKDLEEEISVVPNESKETGAVSENDSDVEEVV